MTVTSYPYHGKEFGHTYESRTKLLLVSATANLRFCKKITSILIFFINERRTCDQARVMQNQRFESSLKKETENGGTYAIALIRLAYHAGVLLPDL